MVVAFCGGGSTVALTHRRRRRWSGDIPSWRRRGDGVLVAQRHDDISMRPRGSAVDLTGGSGTTVGLTGGGGGGARKQRRARMEV